MSIVKANAIVLHSKKQGETSKLVTLYTREFGKITAMAKGSRGVRSKYLGTLETFNVVDVVFYKKEGRGLQYLSQASIIEPFRDIHAKLGKMTLAAIPCEIISRGEEENHPHPRVFKLLLDALLTLERHNKNLRNIVRVFQMHYVVMSGFEPRLHSCHYCGKEEPDAVNHFSLEHGYYSCDHCGASQDSVGITGDALNFLRRFKQTAIADAANATVHPVIGKECDAFLYNYLRAHIEAMATLKAVEHLLKLENEFAAKSQQNLRGLKDL